MALSTNPISAPGETWAQTQARLRAVGAAQQKPINLLGNLPTKLPNTSPNGMQTTTPATMGVRAVSPTTNIQAPASTLPKTQVQTNTASTFNQPGGTNSMGTHILTQAELNAQNNANGQPNTASSVSAGMPIAPVSTATQTQDQTQPTPTYSGILGQLVQTASQPSQAYQDQMAQANQYNQALNQSRMNEATGLAQNFSNPIPLEFQQGRAQVLQNQYLQQQGALANAFQGAAGLVGQANTQQQLQQTGLGTAAGYAKPELGSIGQVPYSPIDLSQGSILGTTQTGGVGAAGKLLGQFQGAQAVGAAAGQAQASNIQTAGTAGVEANKAALNPAYQNYLSLQQTTQNIDQFGQLLTQTMQQGGINPTDVKFANAKLADIRNQLSSGQQAVYDNTLAGLRSRVSGLLAAGGSEIPSQITADATKILDGTLPLSSLSEVLQRIQQEGNVLLGNAANVVNTAYAGATGGAPNQNANTNQPITWGNI